MRAAICMAMVAATMITARPVSACSVSYPEAGLTLYIDDMYPVVAGGAMLVHAGAYTVDIEAAMADLVLWEVRRDGVVQTGTFEVAPLWDAPATSVAPEQHVFAILWRPDQPFSAASVYTLEYRLGHDSEPEPRQVALEVVAAPPAGLPPISVTATSVVVDPGERVCCESFLSSCGDSHQCEATRGTVLPALAVRVGLPDFVETHQVVWVAQMRPDGEIENRLQGEFARSTTPWSWDGIVRFGEPADEYCVVVGAISVVDGSARVSEPYCFSREQLGEPAEGTIELSPQMTPYEPGDPDSGVCRGPLVYEADGAAYPREAEDSGGGGCSVAGRGPWGLLLLGFIRRRRARA